MAYHGPRRWPKRARTSAKSSPTITRIRLPSRSAAPPLCTAIEKAVPRGRTDDGGKNDRGAWSDAPSHHLNVWAKMESAYQAIIEK